MKRNANPAATVAAWNSAYPAGTEVDYRFHRGATPKPRCSADTLLSSGSLACPVALPFPTASRPEPARPAS